MTTQLKRQEERNYRARLEEMRANLLRAVSHDLRTPLTSISTAASLLSDEGEEDVYKRQLQTVAPNEALIVGGSTPVLTQTPEVETTYVYANDTGEYYHLRDCKYVSNYSRKYELPVAYYNGYLPCQECGAPTYMPGGAQ